MLTRNWNDLLREVVELATEEEWFREGLPVRVRRRPGALENSLADRVAELRRFLDKVDLGQVADQRPPLLVGPAAAAPGPAAGPARARGAGRRQPGRRRPGATCRLRESAATGWRSCWATAP